MLKKLFFCNSYHTLIIAIYSLETEPSEIDVVLSSCIPEVEKIENRLKSLDLFNNVFYFDDDELRSKTTMELHNKSKLQGFMYFLFRKNWKYIESKLKICKTINFNNYDQLIVFNANLPVVLVLMGLKKRIVVHEDGKNQLRKIYMKNNHEVLYKMLSPFENKNILWGLPFGMTKYVDYFVTTNPVERDNMLFRKPIKVVKDYEETVLSKKTLEKLRKLFEIDEKILSKKKKMLVLTVSLYKAGIVNSESDQVEVYRQIINRFNSEGMDVFIKPHPLDTVDYNGIKDCIHINKNFPIELVCYEKGVEIELAVTIRSSSILGINAKSKYFYDIDNFKNGKFDVYGGNFI